MNAIETPLRCGQELLLRPAAQGGFQMNLPPNLLRNRIRLHLRHSRRGVGSCAVRQGIRALPAGAVQPREPGHDFRRDGAGGLACSRNRRGRGFRFRTDTGTISCLRGWAAQPITLFRQEDTPVTVGLVVDHSSSMGPKLQSVAAAVSAFAQSSNPEDEMFVVDFGDRVSVELPGGKPFTSNPRRSGAGRLGSLGAWNDCTLRRRGRRAESSATRPLG